MELTSVSYRYRRRGPWVLRGVSMTVPAGVVIEVAGRNGSGKSTLLRLLAGVVLPTEGRVRDRPARVGWVPERFPADQPFTVVQYLRHMSRLRGLRSDRSALDWAERLHLEPFLGVRLPELSKGTAQKVGLVQALVIEPDLLLLDEPWSGLDQETRAVVPAVLADVVKRGGSVVVSDHERRVGQLLAASLRWRVANGAVVDAGTNPAAGPGSDAPASTASTPLAVVQVVLPAIEADAVVSQLRREGRDVRRLR